MYSEKRKFGNIGEESAASHFESKGYRILDRNYLKKFGEIDIVAEKGAKLHFIEVKTVSREIEGKDVRAISRGTWRPEDNVHPAKLKRMHRAISAWIDQHKYEGEWQVDVAAVYLNLETKSGSIRITENVILS